MNKSYFCIQGILECNDKIIPILETIEIEDKQSTFKTNLALIIPSKIYKILKNILKIGNEEITYQEKIIKEKEPYSLISESKKEERKSNIYSDTLKDYIDAFSYILKFLLIDREIDVQSKEERKAFDVLNKTLLKRSIWLKFYLLNNLEIIKKHNFEPPKDDEYRPGLVEFRWYKYITELWRKANNQDYYMYKWMLNYNCPEQIWLMLMIYNYHEEWQKTLTPQAIKGKEKAYNEERNLINIMKSSFDEKGLKSLFDSEDNLSSSKEEKKYHISFQEAFFITVFLDTKSHDSEAYENLLKARSLRNNYVRKNKNVQPLRTNARGELNIETFFI